MQDPITYRNLYYLPLLLGEDGVLTRADAARFQGVDLSPVEDLREYISLHYTHQEGLVDLNGRRYNTRVYRPNTEDDYWYTVVTNEEIPEQLQDDSRAPSDEELSSFQQNLQKVEYSEALSPQESIFISDSFIEPDFEEIDETGTTRRPVSLSTIQEAPRAIIVGPPGAGKTTTLRRLTLHYLEKWKKDSSNAFPIYVQMRHLHEGRGVEATVSKNILEHKKNLDNSLEAGNLGNIRAVLILDGLDEIPNLFRDSAVDSIERFSSKYKTISIITSTREAGYRFQIKSFRHFRILPFNQSKIREWSYYRLADGGSPRWLNFITSLEEREDLQSITTNPLLLSLAVSVYRRTSALPQNRSLLIKAYFDAVTEQWDSSRGVVRQREEWASPAKKLAALCRTAYRLRRAGREHFTSAEFNNWNIEFGVDTMLLDACQRDTGVVRQDRVDGTWVFAHRAFSDYLCARYIIDHTRDVNEYFEPLFKSGDWHDVWVYSCGIAQDATELVRTILHSRRIPKRPKIDALATAFEQDITVSSTVFLECKNYIKNYITKTFSDEFVWERALERQSRVAWVNRFAFNDPIKADTLEVLQALKKLRKSKMGKEILDWLLKANKDYSKSLIDLYQPALIMTHEPICAGRWS
jgi:hypothetical protein